LIGSGVGQEINQEKLMTIQSSGKCKNRIPPKMR
jgi:hypothetical protein